MNSVDLAITIDAAPGKVWAALADFGGIAAWNPSVKAAHLTSPVASGPGATRQCELTPLGVVQERVLDWTENERMAIEIYDFQKMPGMRSAEVVLSLAPVGSATDVNASMEYQVGLGVLGAGMNSLAMRRMLTKALSGLLAGLKHYVETGDPADDDTVLALDSVRMG